MSLETRLNNDLHPSGVTWQAEQVHIRQEAAPMSESIPSPWNWE